MILAGAAAGVGGHYIGSSMDATTPPSSTLMSKSVLIPGVAGILGYFLLRKKNERGLQSSENDRHERQGDQTKLNSGRSPAIAAEMAQAFQPRQTPA